MNGALLLVIASAFFLCGYLVYSKWLAKKPGFDPARKTPAVVKNDGVDYVPARRHESYEYVAPVWVGNQLADGDGELVENWKDYTINADKDDDKGDKDED